jgi:integrase
MSTSTDTGSSRAPWNKGRLTGQKPPLKLKEIWAIRVRLQLASRVRDLAMFNLAIDSKLRACDLTKLRVRDVCHGEHVASRAMIMQQKTQRPVQFEITEQTRESVAAWIRHVGLHATAFLFPSSQRPLANRPDDLQLRLFRHFKCVIYLDAEVPDCTFKFRVTEQQLNGPEVLRATIDQRHLGPAHRVGTVGRVVKAN